MNNWLRREKLPIKPRIKTIHPAKNRFLSTKLIIFLIIPFLISACGPTYPREKVIESIIKISREKYGVEVKAKQINKTICVLVPGEDFFGIDEGGRLAFNPEKEKKLNELLFSIPRILFNSDIEVDFYLIKVLEENKGIELRFIGYVDDIKHAIIGSFSPGDLRMRRVLEVTRYSKSDITEREKFEEAKWADFLIKQIQNRVTAKFPGKIDLAGNKEGEKFVFVLVSRETTQKIIDYTCQTIARVMEAYKFKDFESVSLLELNSGKIIVLDKNNLKKYR
ncbi:MAG: hypothetical protein U9Q24_02205 [Candidatus Ratteibacteria bacterium]|nr:hypothetical protein [Candidatus Ratteibacteria bacterium]